MSKILIFLLIIHLSLITATPYDLLDPVKRPLLNFFVGTNNKSDCVRTCSQHIFDQLTDFLKSTTVTPKTIDNICKAHKKLRKCVENERKCDENDVEMMEKLQMGFDWACVEPKRGPFQYVLPCMTNMKFQHNCSKQCEMTLNGVDHHQKSFFNRYGRLCQPFACYVNCTAKELDKQCPTAGSRIAHTFLLPFDEMAAEFDSTNPNEQKLILSLIPAGCRQYFFQTDLLQIRFDKKFMRDLMYLVSSVKLSTRKFALTHSEKLIDELQVYFRQKNSTERIFELESLQPPPPLPWDRESIIVMTTIGILMIVNVIGLFFTCWWCLTSKEERFERIDSQMTVNQFVEPEIRMKLKLPKMRSDAIHDSHHQEILELRVPRNGNQFHENEQQTVVVPRNKRRRTYSVPLEPRPRTQSTGSDHFPRIVIQNHHHH